MLFAALVAAALGLASYQYLYLPFELRQSSSHVALIASLGLFIVLENLIAIVFGTGGRVVGTGIAAGRGTTKTVTRKVSESNTPLLTR